MCLAKPVQSVLWLYLQVDPFKKPCKNLFLYETLMALMKEEENVLMRIKDSEKEVERY